MPSPSVPTVAGCPCFGCASARRLRARGELNLIEMLRRRLGLACSDTHSVTEDRGRRDANTGSEPSTHNRMTDLQFSRDRRLQFMSRSVCRIYPGDITYLLA